MSETGPLSPSVEPESTGKVGPEGGEEVSFPSVDPPAPAPLVAPTTEEHLAAMRADIAEIKAIVQRGESALSELRGKIKGGILGKFLGDG